MAIKELLLGLNDMPGLIVETSTTKLKRLTVIAPANKRKTGGSSNGRNDQTSKDITNHDDSDDENLTIKSEAETPIVPPPPKPPRTKRKRPAPQIVAEPMPSMVLAVDFGMTNSAIAYCVKTGNPEMVKCMKRFPGSTDTSSKVPTVIAYRQENKEHETFGQNPDLDSIFGFEVPKDAKYHAFFKLALSHSSRNEKFDDPALEARGSELLLNASRGGTGQQAVEDAFRHLSTIFRDHVKARSGDRTLNGYKLEVVITHPAAFSPKSLENLHDAVVASGILANPQDKFDLKSESECAAVAAFFINRKNFGTKYWENAFKDQSGVLVLDIGGLTCDAATFQVAKNRPHLKVKQSCSSQGGNCGTVALYCRLYQYLAHRHGDHFTSLPESSVGPNSPIIKDFVKDLGVFTANSFKLDRHRRFELAMDIPDEPDVYESGKVLIQGHEIRKMLDANLEYSKNILEDQFAAHKKANPQSKITTVVLCGGGSNFPYVATELKAFCKKSPMNCNIVLVPEDPMAVVVEGALISSLEQRVVEKRRSRAAYGVSVHRRWVQGDWKAADVFTCSYGQRRIKGFMQWHVEKGDTIDMSKLGVGAKVDCYIMLSLDDLESDSPTEYRITIYSYIGDQRPPPDRVEHSDVHRLGTFVVRPSEISASKKRELRRKWRDSGASSIDVKIVQLVNSRDGLIMFEARVGNAKIGQYRLEFDATMEPEPHEI